MSEPAGDGLRFLLQPEAVIVEVVCAVETGMDPGVVGPLVRQVLATRTLQRRVARALTEDPTLLESGRSGGPPRLASLIGALRRAGAHRLVLPCCARCGRAVRLVGLAADGRRICSTCQGKTNIPRVACAGCGALARISAYDVRGLPLCVRCAIAERAVDHLGVVVDHLAGLDTGLPADGLRQIAADAVRSSHKQRALRAELDADPQLLRSRPAHGSPRIIVLAQALLAAGARNIASMTCPFCHRPTRLPHGRDGLRCCGRCYNAAREQQCSRCARHQRVFSRTAAGQPLCGACTARDPVNHEVCPNCRRRTALFTTTGGTRRLCAACNGLPQARCTVCGKDKPCRHTASGPPRCVACINRQRGTRTCSRCGADRQVYGRDPDGGPLCRSCTDKHQPCLRCQRLMRVVARLPDGPLCARCWKTEPAAARPCTGCGATEVPYHFGVCAACAWPAVLGELLTGPHGGLHPGARAVLDVLLTAQPAGLTGQADQERTGRARGLLEWARRPRPRAVLLALAQQSGGLSHDLLDRLPAGRTVDRLRATLVTAGALVARDDQLAMLQRWLATKTATLTDAGERAVVQRFTTWYHLQRLRRRPAATPVTFAQAQAVRARIGVCIRLLAWLREHDRTLATATQHDIDDWLAASPQHYHTARIFLLWAVRGGHARDVQIPIRNYHYLRQVLPETDQRWAATRRLLHDDTLHLPDRVAGLLVLLFGQSPAGIVALTIHDVIRTDQDTHLRLGPAPVHLPEPTDDLLHRLIRTRRTSTLLGPTTDHPWLFPGASPARPMAAHTLGTRLRTLGVPPRLARNTALMDLANQLPAPVLAQLLGLHIITATRWTQEAGNNRPAYAAHTARANATRTTQPVT